MTLQTYSDLVSAIGDWLMRDDLIQVIPHFISLGESDYLRRLRLNSMVTRTTLTATDGVASLPQDCLQVRTVSASAGQLSLLPATLFDDLAVTASGSTPLHYTVEGASLRVLPAAASAELTVTYYARPEPLSEANPTTPILTAHPDIPLYASLLASAPYLGDDQRGVVWKTLLDEAIIRADGADEAAEYAGHLVIRAD
jgi:hypothetical protein